ncbi:MAG: hypothetical protein HY554_10715 [Elusimicrobia bacterium]|nr:hypothetical protein [Elusimicrobiota bacterium]
MVLALLLGWLAGSCVAGDDPARSRMMIVPERAAPRPAPRAVPARATAAPSRPRLQRLPSLGGGASGVAAGTSPGAIGHADAGRLQATLTRHLQSAMGALDQAMAELRAP